MESSFHLNFFTSTFLTLQNYFHLHRDKRMKKHAVSKQEKTYQKYNI